MCFCFKQKTSYDMRISDWSSDVCSSDLVDLACRWYERQRHTAAGDAARRYLGDRGLKDETVACFRLGWAPEDRRALQRAMKAEGVDVDVLVEAGLVKRYDEDRKSTRLNSRH